MHRLIASVMLLTALTAPLWSQTTSTDMQWLRVGNPGNPAYDGRVGQVDYVYEIGKYEVTIAQYIEFLNAVATIDDRFELLFVNPEIP
jgi:hypothetical protein